MYGQLEGAIDGLHDACVALGTPVTGGNVSLYNQYRAEDGSTHAVHPTPTVGMVGVLPDVAKHATIAFKRPDDRVVLVGLSRDELGGSVWAAQRAGRDVGTPPSLDLEAAARTVRAVADVIQAGLCDTAHDLSDGGLAVAVAEMALAGDLGADLDLRAVAEASKLDATACLFAESAPRVLLAVRPADAAEVGARLDAARVPYHDLGAVGGDLLRLELPGGAALELPLPRLRAPYETRLEEALA